jgi:integrase
MLVSEFRTREFTSIKRNELVRLADKTAETSGSRTAEYLVMTFSAVSRWHARRHEDYNSPVVPGMTKEFRGKARERILSDDELRAVWKEAERRGDNFGVLIRLLLLTGQRREKIASMRWSDLADSTWTIRTEEREKPNAGTLTLPQVALDIINAQVRMGSNPFVLPARAGAHISAFNRYKAAFDKATGPLPHWTLHDLRRTSRSLMSRAGVRPDIAERVLGHTIKGVEAVYDRHQYSEEKARALQMLARQIETIVKPPTNNVTPIRKAG